MGPRRAKVGRSKRIDGHYSPVTPGRVYTPLRDLALDHHGFLTTDHARQLGVDPHRLQVMEGRGLVEGVSRGVFRFADIPAGALDQ